MAVNLQNLKNKIAGMQIPTIDQAVRSASGVISDAVMKQAMEVVGKISSDEDKLLLIIEIQKLAKPSRQKMIDTLASLITNIKDDEHRKKLAAAELAKAISFHKRKVFESVFGELSDEVKTSDIVAAFRGETGTDDDQYRILDRVMPDSWAEYREKSAVFLKEHGGKMIEPAEFRKIVNRLVDDYMEETEIESDEELEELISEVESLVNQNAGWTPELAEEWNNLQSIKNDALKEWEEYVDEAKKEHTKVFPVGKKGRAASRKVEFNFQPNIVLDK